MATIIDAFLITLGLDPKGYHEGVAGAEKDMEKLKKHSTETANHLKEEGERGKEFFRGLLEGALSFFAVIASGRELMNFISETSEADKSTGRLAKALGIGVEELDAWQKACIMADGTAEGFQASVKALAGNLVDIEKGLPRAERALKVFNAAGVTGLARGRHAEVLEVLDQLAEMMSKMNAFEAMRLGQRMGLDEGTIRLLRQGKEGIAQVREEMASLGLTSQADVDAAESLEDAQKKLKMSGTAVGHQIMQVMLPALQWIAEKLLVVSQWAKEHGETVKAVFVGLAAGLTAAAVAALPLAAEMIAISWPIFAIGVAVAALAAGITYLMIEWKKWKEGGEQATGALGYFFASVQIVWDKIKGVVTTVLATVWDLIKDYVEIWIDQLSLIAAFFSGDTKRISEAWDKLCKDMVEFFQLALKLVLYWMFVQLHLLLNAWNNLWAKMKNAPSELFEWLVNKFNALGPVGKLLVMAAGGFPGVALTGIAPAAGMAMHPTSYFSTSSAVSSSREVHIGKIEIATQATDPGGIAAGIGDGIRSHGLVDQADGGY